MARVEVFKKSIWRKIDEETTHLKKGYEQKKAEIKNQLADPETRQKIAKTATLVAGATIFALEVRRLLKPTLADIERHQKLYSYYDPHSHIRFNTKRKVRPEVAYEILKRTDLGEDVLDILKEKKLI